MLPNIQLPYQHIGLQSQKQWRMVLFQLSIINKGTVSIKVSAKTTCLYSDIVTESDTIRLYNIHLASNWLDKVITLLCKILLETEELKKNVLSIVERLKISFAKRAEQVEAIKNHINKSPYSVILCGDFNDTPTHTLAINYLMGLRML